MENNNMNIYSLVCLHLGTNNCKKSEKGNKVINVCLFKKHAHTYIFLQDPYRNQLENLHIVPVGNMPT